MRHLMTIPILFVLGLGLGCSDEDDDHDGRPAECETIVKACHAADPGSGEIHQCHENAEATWTKDQCTANSTRCLNLCQAGDGGTRG